MFEDRRYAAKADEDGGGRRETWFMHKGEMDNNSL